MGRMYTVPVHAIINRLHNVSSDQMQKLNLHPNLFDLSGINTKSVNLKNISQTSFDWHHFDVFIIFQ